MFITDVTTQLKNIMPAVGLGFVLGVVHLLIRIVRALLSDSKVFVFAADVLFIVGCTLSSYLLLVAVNNGHLSFYLILAEILGYCSFVFTFGEMIFNFSFHIISVVKKILSPFLLPFKFVKRKINEIMKKDSQNIENFKNKFKKLLKPRNKVVYNNKD